MVSIAIFQSNVPGAVEVPGIWMSRDVHSLSFQIKLQESPEDMPAGQTPHTVVLFAHNDLVDKVQPGDRVHITGEGLHRQASDLVGGR